MDDFLEEEAVEDAIEEETDEQRAAKIKEEQEERTFVTPTMARDHLREVQLLLLAAI